MVKPSLFLTALLIVATPIIIQPNPTAIQEEQSISPTWKRLYFTWDAMSSSALGAATGYFSAQLFNNVKEQGYGTIATILISLIEMNLRSSCTGIIQEIEAQKYAHPNDIALSKGIMTLCTTLAFYGLYFSYKA